MKKIVFLACVMAAIIGCTDNDNDNDNEEIIPHSNKTRIVLSEFTSGGSGISNVTKTEEFIYEYQWLTEYTYTQTASIYDHIGDRVETIINPTTIQYANDSTSVTLTDKVGTQRRYTLNELGYATACEYTTVGQKREYTFAYTDGYLTRIDERILPAEGSSKAPILQTLMLNYDEGELVSATSPSQTGSATPAYEQFYEAGRETNYYHLPCPALADTYPLSFHREAMYAGMLGRPTPHLTTATYTAPTTTGSFERTQYTYSIDSDHKPTRLNIQTRYGNGIGTKTINRTVTITIESIF